MLTENTPQGSTPQDSVCQHVCVCVCVCLLGNQQGSQYLHLN